LETRYQALFISAQSLQTNFFGMPAIQLFRQPLVKALRLRN
jgi:hypothetical protein